MAQFCEYKSGFGQLPFAKLTDCEWSGLVNLVHPAERELATVKKRLQHTRDILGIVETQLNEQIRLREQSSKTVNTCTITCANKTLCPDIEELKAENSRLKDELSRANKAKLVETGVINVLKAETKQKSEEHVVLVAQMEEKDSIIQSLTHRNKFLDDECNSLIKESNEKINDYKVETDRLHTKMDSYAEIDMFHCQQRDEAQKLVKTLQKQLNQRQTKRAGKFGR